MTTHWLCVRTPAITDRASIYVPWKTINNYRRLIPSFSSLFSLFLLFSLFPSFSQFTLLTVFHHFITVYPFRRKGCVTTTLAFGLRANRKIPHIISTVVYRQNETANRVKIIDSLKIWKPICRLTVSITVLWTHIYWVQLL